MEEGFVWRLSMSGDSLDYDDLPVNGLPQELDTARKVKTTLEKIQQLPTGYHVIEDRYPSDSFLGIFWRQQRRAASLKNLKWEAAMIRLVLIFFINFNHVL